MARQLAPEVVRETLERRAFADLIGVMEDQHFECKQMPYQLGTDTGKYELAKDVSAFANVTGGVILIGFRTGRPDPAHPIDEITDVRLVTQGQVNIAQYHDVLKSWIFPALDGAEIMWYADMVEADKGVLAIYVEAVAALKPFLITRVIDDPERPAVERFCAYVERRRAGTSAMSVQEIQASLRIGRSGVGIHIDRLEALAGRIERALPPAQPVETPPLTTEIRAEEIRLNAHAPTVVVEATLAQTIAAAVEASGIREGPIWIMAAQPSGTTVIRDFLGSAGVSRLLRNPPALRPNGFDTTTEIDRESFDGQTRRAVIREYKLLEVSRSGRATFVTTAGADFLSWGSRDSPMLRINPLALAESAYAFAEFVERLEPQLEMHFNTREYRVELRGLMERPMEVVPYALFTSGWEHPRNVRMIDTDFSIPLVLPADTPPQVVAFRICAEVYARAGFNDDEVPYAVAGPAGRHLDVARIERGGAASPAS